MNVFRLLELASERLHTTMRFSMSKPIPFLASYDQQVSCRTRRHRSTAVLHKLVAAMIVQAYDDRHHDRCGCA